MESTLGNYSEGKRLLLEAFEILEPFEGEPVAGWTKYLQGKSFFEQGNLGKASKYAQESLEIFHESTNQEVPALAATLLANVRCEQVDLTAAETCLNEAKDYWRIIDGYKWGIAHTHLVQGKLAYIQKDYSLALEFISSSLNLREKIDDKLGLAQCYEALAYLKIATEEPELAAEVLAKAESLRREIAAPLPPIAQEAYQTALQKLNN